MSLLRDTQRVYQSIKKAEIPEELLRYVTLDLKSGNITSSWTDVVGWKSCKLQVRKVGNGTRFRISHYGYYDCCDVERLRQGGYTVKSTSIHDMPIFMYDHWNKLKRARPGIRFAGFERTGAKSFTLHFRMPEGSKMFPEATLWQVRCVKGMDFPVSYLNLEYSEWEQRPYVGGDVLSELASA